MSQWREKTLRQAGVSLIDCDHRTPPASETGYPYIAIPQLKQGRLDLADVRRITREHFLEWTRKAKPQPHDVILSRRCNPGETAVVPERLECALGQNLVLLRADPTKMFPPFLRWLVRSGQWWEQIGTFLNVGAVFDSLKCADIPNFCLPIPPLPEQRAIASVLGALDDKIELNRRMNETLEALAQSLFKAWFVDATQDGLPKGWREGKISDICSTQYGYTARAIEEAVGPKFLRVMDINKQNWIDWSSVPHCSIPEKDKSRYALSVGDIVVARMADPGKSAIVEQPIDAVFASYLVRLKAESLAHAYYLYYFLKASAYTDYAEGAMSGSVQANMNAKVIVAAELPVPPSLLMEAFLAKVLPLRQRIVANLNESRTLAALRDALLPKLLSGELRVPAGKLVEAIA